MQICGSLCRNPLRLRPQEEEKEKGGGSGAEEEEEREEEKEGMWQQGGKAPGSLSDQPGYAHLTGEGWDFGCIQPPLCYPPALEPLF